jgi:hypothetical protein
LRPGAPSYDPAADAVRTLEQAGPLENIANEGESLVTQQDHRQSRAIHALQGDAESRLAQQVRAAIRRYSMATDDHLYHLSFAGRERSGQDHDAGVSDVVIQIPLFSYFNVAASYTSISKPAP